MLEESAGRTFSRSPIRVRAAISCPCGVVIDTITHDISMNGVLVQSDRSLPQGAECVIALMLDSGTESITLRIKGRVARLEGSQVAIEFFEVSADDLPHLRSLVLYNAPDAETAEQEFEGHPGLKK